jgi:hypothetical protein
MAALYLLRVLMHPYYVRSQAHTSMAGIYHQIKTTFTEDYGCQLENDLRFLDRIIPAHRAAIRQWPVDLQHVLPTASPAGPGWGQIS